ncbi:C3H1-type domain-containing protein [Plasmodiophora brassicae]|uniref:C3H1-type domain-containing protein n=1 Tax=Plasmodiophora brassicae TaxID=37360 RepID=A0A3P3YCW3_PLABS|nr:unnamed protein product [Plasmodiophora brassicae]
MVAAFADTDEGAGREDGEDPGAAACEPVPASLTDQFWIAGVRYGYDPESGAVTLGHDAAFGPLPESSPIPAAIRRHVVPRRTATGTLHNGASRLGSLYAPRPSTPVVQVDHLVPYLEMRSPPSSMCPWRKPTPLAFLDEGEPAGTLSRKNYKTELCLNWAREGGCRYRSDCHFAHGAHELVRRRPAGSTPPTPTKAPPGSLADARDPWPRFEHKPPARPKAAPDKPSDDDDGGELDWDAACATYRWLTR